MAKIITWGLSEVENRQLASEIDEVHEVFTADGLFHASEFSKKSEAIAVVRVSRLENPLLEVLERFSVDRGRVPLVVVVDSADPELITRAYEAGARRVTVGKLFSVQQLGLSKELPGSWLPLEAMPAQAWVQ